MKIKKKIISVILIIILLLTYSLNVYAFNDIQYGEWYYNTVVYLQQEHIIDGYEDNTFRPNNTCLKSEALKMFLLQAGEEIDFLNEYNPWYKPYTDIALKKGYISNSFYSTIKNNITRYEVAELIVKVFNLEEQVKNININKFVDTRNYYVSILSSLNLIHGYLENGKFYFKGNNNLTRAELCTLVINIQKYFNVYNGETRYKDIKWYYGANDISELINPNIKITSTPYTAEEFVEILKFMTINEVYSLSFIYPYDTNGTYNQKAELLNETINKAVDIFREKYVEYGSFYSQFKKTIKQTNNNNFSLRLEISSDLYTNNEINHMKSETFQKIISLRNEFYKTGNLTYKMTNLEKAKYYYNWIVKNFEYDYSLNRTSTNPYSAFETNKITCMGYTSIFNLFLKLEGIETTGIICKIKEDNSNHIWTYAYIDGKWRCFDVTAGELSNDLTFFDISENILQKFYEY